MFGYIRVNKPECKIREYEYYRAVYCGLCRSLGRCTGQCSRMALSYDMTFLSLVRMALENRRPTIVKGRCPLHPLRARPMAKPPKGSEEEQVLSLCACATVLLSYHKLRDDLADERGLKRLRALAAIPFFSLPRRRALRHFAPLDKVLFDGLSELSRWEKSGETSVDVPAEMFGVLLGEVLAYQLEEPTARIAKEIGVHLGKWIYLIDAIDDYEEDVKRGRYNPLAKVYPNGLDTQARESLSVALTVELCEAEKAFDLLDYPDGDMEAVIKNVLYLGMPQTAKRVVLLPCGKGAVHE